MVLITACHEIDRFIFLFGYDKLRKWINPRSVSERGSFIFEDPDEDLHFKDILMYHKLTQGIKKIDRETR